MQPQQVDITDIDIQQSADIRRQLEEVSLPIACRSRISLHETGVESAHQLFVQLKQVQPKFKQCLVNVAEAKPKNTGQSTCLLFV